MQVTICGPNLNDQSKGDFHVHAANCSDLVKHARREPEYGNGWTIEVSNALEVAAEVYADQIAENEPGTTYASPDAYMSDFHFFPCCSKDLA